MFVIGVCVTASVTVPETAGSASSENERSTTPPGASVITLP